MFENRSFSSDVAHELRTPLAGLRAQLDLSLSRERSTQEYKKTIGQCLSITEQTGEIVESLLETTRESMAASPPEHVDLHSLLNVLFIERQQNMQSRKLQFKHRDCKDVSILIQQRPLLVILRNLVDNAVCYADLDSTIEVSAESSDNNCVVVISNQARTFLLTISIRSSTGFGERTPHVMKLADTVGLGFRFVEDWQSRWEVSIQASIVDQSFRIELKLPCQSNSLSNQHQCVVTKLGVSFFSHESPCHSGCIDKTHAPRMIDACWLLLLLHELVRMGRNRF